jgi:hypothetical protein
MISTLFFEHGQQQIRIREKQSGSLSELCIANLW